MSAVMEMLDLRATTRAVRPPLAPAYVGLAAKHPTSDAIMLCERLIREIQSANLVESAWETLGRYANRYGQGFPLVDRLVEAAAQEPFTDDTPGDRLPATYQQLFEWLQVGEGQSDELGQDGIDRLHLLAANEVAQVLAKRHDDPQDNSSAWIRAWWAAEAAVLRELAKEPAARTCRKMALGSEWLWQVWFACGTSLPKSAKIRRLLDSAPPQPHDLEHAIFEAGLHHLRADGNTPELRKSWLWQLRRALIVRCWPDA